METIKTIAFILLIGWGAISGYQWYAHSDFIPPADHDEMLDEVTRAKSAEIAARDVIVARLETQVADAIKQRDEAVAARVEISGRLRAVRDDLQTARQQLQLASILSQDPDTGELVVEETTVTEIVTFTEELFRITCTATFSKDGCFTMDANLDVLRDTDISITLADRGNDYLMVYYHLPDFEMEGTRVLTFQPDPAPKQEFNIWKQTRSLLIYGGIGVAFLKVLELVFG